MRVLVVNCGSSSIKLAVVEAGRRVAETRLERVDDPVEALASALPDLAKGIDAVGHRVVHGGETFAAPTVLDDDVVATLTTLVPLAPLHLPANLAGIAAARALLPSVPHVAVFDTAFHATLPRRARAYALPKELAAAYGIRRYGFHGPSHAFVARRAAAFLGEDLADLRIITCHLGNGASVCAVEYGRSVETSMGMTPLEGLVMGTRAGDVDAGVLIHLLRRGLDVDGLDVVLNEQSGLLGLSGVSNDLRDLEAGDDDARFALQVFAHRVRKYIGAYAVVMGGVDAIVFTGGIGENSASMRHRIAQRLDFLGARFDEDRNRDVHLDPASPVASLSAGGRCALLAVATDEAVAIAADVEPVVRAAPVGPGTIPIAISARHVHLTDEAVATLFGPGHQLTPRAPLSQPGQFACEETVTVVGPRRRLERVRVIGPTRPGCQVEVSRTDEFFLGVDAPVRNSGDTKNSPGCTLIGPAGSLTLTEGLICARRHIHMHPDDAERFGVRDRDVVEVAVDSDGRDLIFGDVLVRVKPSYRLEMHLDTDEANAAELRSGDQAVLADTGRVASLRKRR